MATSSAAGSGGALVAPQFGATEHVHAKKGGGKLTHSHEDAEPGHGHDDLLPLPAPSTVRAFHLDLDIKSVDVAPLENAYGVPAGSLILDGYANTWAEDRDKEQFVRAAFDEAIDRYWLNPVLLDQHDRDHPIGYMLERPVLDDTGVWVKAVVPVPPPKAAAWWVKAFHDIKSRTRRAFSVGGLFTKDGSHITGIDWCETSVVTVPSNAYSIFQVAEAKGLDWELLDEKATMVQQPGVGRGHGAHHHGGHGRLGPKGTRGRRSRRGALAPRARSPRRHKHLADGGYTGFWVEHTHGAAADAHSHPSMKAARDFEVKAAVGDAEPAQPDTPAHEADEIAGRGDIGSLMQGLLEALNEVIDADDLTEDDKVENVAEILDDFLDEAQDRLGATEIPDDTEPAKWAHALAVKAGAIQLVNALAPYTRGMEDIMADTERQERVPAPDTKAAPAPDETTFSGPEVKAMARQLETLVAEKNERELERKAEAEAARRLEAEAKAETERKAADEAERKKLDEMVSQKLAAMNSGRKFAFSPLVNSPAGQDQHKHLGEWLHDLVDMRRGNPEAYQRITEGHKAATEHYWGAKALGEGGGATGGYLVPPQYWQAGIAEFRIAAAKVRPLVSVMQTNSNLVYIPRATGIATVAWVAENAAKPSTDQTFGQLAVNIFTLAGIAKISKQLVDDSNPMVDSIVRKDLGRILGQAEDVAMLNGNGNGQPTGILQTTGVLTVAVGAGSIFDAVSAALTAVEVNYFGAATAMVAHPRVVQTMRQKKDSTGRYLADPGYTNGMGVFDRSLYGADPQAPTAIGTVWGIPLISDANVPTTFNGTNPLGGTEAPLIVGNFQEAYLLERVGITIDTSGEAGTSFEANQYWFRGEERLGFTAARQPTAFAFVTGLTPAAG